MASTFGIVRWLALFQLISIVVSQNSTVSSAVEVGGPPAIFLKCIQQFISMNISLLDTSTADTSLCSSGGSFWNSMSSAQVCFGGLQIPQVPQTSFDHFNSLLSSCNAIVNSSISTSCASLSSQGQGCTITASYFGQPASVSATATSASASLSTASAQTAAEQPSNTSSQGAAVNKSGTDVGLVAGVAVGAAVGALAITAAIGFFIWRHRKRAKAGRDPQELDSCSSGDTEKGELSTDSGKVELGANDRKELASDGGSLRTELASPPMYARSVGTLQELDAAKRQSTIKELASNEEVASEMSTTVCSSSIDGMSSKV